MFIYLFLFLLFTKSTTIFDQGSEIMLNKRGEQQKWKLITINNKSKILTLIILIIKNKIKIFNEIKKVTS
jgi:hypothetical protein